MTTKRKRKPAPDTAAPACKSDPDALPPEAAEIVLRLLACAMGLPRICALKVCRRHRQCRGRDMICRIHHRGLAAKRIDAAIRRISTPPASGRPRA